MVEVTETTPPVPPVPRLPLTLMEVVLLSVCVWAVKERGLRGVSLRGVIVSW